MLSYLAMANFLSSEDNPAIQEKGAQLPMYDQSMMDTKPNPNSEPSLDAQARGFEAARASRQFEMAEDYVELIADLIRLNGQARPVDIALRFGVSAPTVSKNLARLKRVGLVQHEPYRAVQLTPEGEKLARSCRERHRTVVDFLMVLGLPQEIAERDAEGLEHHVSDETLTTFREFTIRHKEG
jgi:DtxR family transcriptional regulator, manganese transport regulator